MSDVPAGDAAAKGSASPFDRRDLGYWLVYVLALAVPFGAWAGGWWTLTPALLAFGGFSLVDMMIGTDTRNVPRDLEARRVGEVAFNLPLYLWVPTQLALAFGGAWYVATAALTPLETVGLILGIGVATGGAGITIAHELVHRKDRAERLMGEIVLYPVLYSHWAVEHVRGHHIWVATEKDPATARRGESVYRFWGRSVVGGFKSAWAIEADRRRAKGEKVWVWGNPVARGLWVQAAMGLAVLAWLGPVGVLVFVGQAIVAFSLLEIVNYFEHYGLTRRIRDNGRPEPVLPQHSWNDSHRISNWLLFELGRHSDHHANAGRAYPILRHHDDVPQLPVGYETAVILALIPPLWFRLMNPRLDAWYAAYGTPAAT